MTALPDGCLDFTLLRHGRSLADDEGKHEGRYDSPLTEVGRFQARLLADYWQNHPPLITRIVSSPLRRASETAEIIGESLRVPVEGSDLWLERDNGPLAGLQRDEAAARYPLPSFRSRWSPKTPDGGESMAALDRRADQALEELIEPRSGHTLVVAHGGVLNSALKALLGHHRGMVAFGFTAYARVRLSAESDEPTLLCAGHTPHLPPE